MEQEARNYDKFAINGAGKYGKARMVEAVVNTYVQNNPSISIDALKEVFPNHLLKGFGVIRTEDGTIKDYKRFYKSALPDGTVFYICNQWGKDATENFVQFVNEKVAGITISKASELDDADLASAAEEAAIAEAEAARVEAEKEAAAAKAAIEKAKAEAEAARLAAEREAAAIKAEVEKAKAEAEAIRLAAEKEAAAAKAAIEKANADAETARLAAEKEAAAAKAAIEKAKAEAEEKAKGTTGKVAGNAGALPGVFTLKDGKKIRFSQGNLQFHPKNYEFRFAKEQYETLGKEANEKCSPTLDGWIDIFGWGTSGYMGCQPTELDTKFESYGPRYRGIAGTNYDWGIYNPISNGGNKEGIWRTLSTFEWQYLLEERSSAEKLKLVCTVCGERGFLLLPDNFWNNRLRFAIDTTTSKNEDNIFNAEQWEQLESLGAVFFPETTICHVSNNIWEFTTYKSNYMWSSCSQYKMLGTSWKPVEGVSRVQKLPVRLVQDVK